jgi:hypothetical protein
MPYEELAELGQGLGVVRQAASLDGAAPFKKVADFLLAAAAARRGLRRLMREASQANPSFQGRYFMFLM